ncbi:predicted protein [Uncinocarpus reesii 1704]|uniref:PHD-type domain-containing protein n=1 Tax=Uncinocarpus reesii (strain UAMH 1704) TaxID=336963 RepID=C4JUR9_UNCRE|nr:uncharacterized protein UREG_04872 [Uncinocarpus reesii 1704]EEP80030.1 predicted protein [Uncinocarpus reesii 1704]
MAPQLRSRTRAAGDSSRPATPLDAPQSNTATSSETSRPKKQRKTGAKTSVPVGNTAEEPARKRKRKTKVGPAESIQESSDQQTTGAESQTDPSRPPSARNTRPLPPSTWKEPRSWKKKTKPSFEDLKVRRGGIFQHQFGLGSRPTLANLRTGKLVEDDEETVAKKQAAKGKKRGRVAKSRRSRKSKKPAKATSQAKATQALETAINDSTAASTSQEEPVTPETVPAEEEQHIVTEENEPVVQHTHSDSGKDLEADIAQPVNTSTAPPVPMELKCSKERFNEVFESTISRAQASNDIKVAEGLRWMLTAAETDPFLLKIMDDVVADPTQEHTAVFQAALRDVVKKLKAEEPVAAATVEGREESSSSLSTAKSLEADTTKSLEADTAAPIQPPKIWQPLWDEGLRPEEEDPNPYLPTDPVIPACPKKRVGKHPELVALAGKKRALSNAKEYPGYKVRASNLRTRIVVQPQPQPPRRLARSFDDDDAASVQSVENRKSKPADIDNNDFCRVCNGTGNLLCCDGCVDSFHFACLSPPLDANSPPAGQWFCPTCERKGPGAVFEAAMDTIPRARYEVPAEIRNEFAEVQTAEDGSYEHHRPEELPPTVKETKKLTWDQMADARVKVFHERDDNGNLIICTRCHRANLEGERQVMKCDHCSSWWHLDCLDENYSHPPLQFTGSSNPRHYWKCPNHLDSMLKGLGDGVRFRRRRRHHELADVELLPSAYETDSFHQEDNYGKGFRVTERGMIQNFIERARRDHAERRALNALKAVEDQARALLVPTGGTPGSSVGVANAAGALVDRCPEEREGALALLAMANPQPASSRVGQLVSQLVAESPETVRNATSEIELLQSLQGLISQRLQGLTATSSTDVTN